MRLLEKGQRLADIRTLLTRHAAGPGAYTSLLAAYAATLRTTTSQKELQFSLRIKTSVFPFHMRQSDVFVLEEILLQKQYELATPLMRNPVIIDAGANIGVATLWLRASYPESTIYAFEPEAENARLLRLNTSSLARVAVEQAALGRVSELVGLHRANHGALHSIVQQEGTGAFDAQVNCLRLEDYMTQKSIARVDLLKVDVEGSELDLLIGLGDRINDVGVIVGEMHETIVDEGEFYRYLADRGFRQVRKQYFGSGQAEGVHAFEASR